MSKKTKNLTKLKIFGWKETRAERLLAGVKERDARQRVVTETAASSLSKL